MSAAAQVHAAPRRMFIGVHDGHNASVAIIRNGNLEFALQEERLTRVKNQGDLPQKALALALSRAQDTDLVSVALNGDFMNYGQWSREAVLHDYAASAGARARWKQPLKNTFVDRLYQGHKAAKRAEILASAGIATEQTVSVEHHRAHASAAYYTAPWRSSPTSFPDRTLVFTCDGSGDRLSATVSIGQGATLTRIAEITEHDSIGRLYSLVTNQLGMVPLEHEYKVMGLAPYASSARSSIEVANEFESWFDFPSALRWKRRSGIPSMYAASAFLGQALAGRRFDHIAAGAQLFIERMLTRWIRGAIRETGISRIACGGGVFMNVKANLAILELPEVEDMYVFPSCGDESNSIGAACWEAARVGEPVAPLKGMYFGDSISDQEAEDSLRQASEQGSKLRFTWRPNIESTTAEALATGHVVARAKGPAEFGARALGNRSILARADRPEAVRFINEAIKCRDFWMPFAPAVIAEQADRYYTKPRPVASPYMMFAFRSRPESAGSYIAAQHPYDGTARAQEVFAEHNPDFHRLLEHHENRTGEAIVLNTSFNLHGEPIVDRASDAVNVFLRSGLTCMALGNWWVEKQP